MGQWLTAVSGFQSQLSHLPTIHFRQVTYPLHALASASIRIPTSKGCCEEKKYMVTQVRHLDLCPAQGRCYINAGNWYPNYVNTYALKRLYRNV